MNIVNLAAEHLAPHEDPSFRGKRFLSEDQIFDGINLPKPQHPIPNKFTSHQKIPTLKPFQFNLNQTLMHSRHAPPYNCFRKTAMTLKKTLI